MANLLWQTKQEVKYMLLVTSAVVWDIIYHSPTTDHKFLLPEILSIYNIPRCILLFKLLRHEA